MAATTAQITFIIGTVVGFVIGVIFHFLTYMISSKKRRHRFYFTLEEDLTYCFKRRGIQVKEIIVSNAASKYTIKVIR